MAKFTKFLGGFIFFILIFILVYSISVRFCVVDFDLFSRLIQGFCVLNTGSVFYYDALSYTPTHLWYDPEWLSSALFYFISQKFGILGLNILKILLNFGIILSIALAIRGAKKTQESFYNIGIYILSIIILTQSSIVDFLVRCQLFSYIFLAFWIMFLEKIRKGKNAYLVILPFFMLIWLNTHGASIAGVGILFLYILGEFLNKKPIKKYLISFVFVCLSFLINPWGHKFIRFMLDSSYLNRSWIAEWKPTLTLGVTNACILIFLSFVIVYFLNIYLKKIDLKSLDKTKALVLFVVGFLTLSHIKHLGLFMVVYPIYLYDDFYYVYNSIMEKIRLKLEIEEGSIENIKIAKKIILSSAIILYFLFTFIRYPLNSSYISRTKSAFPLSAVEFLRENNIKGNILSPFQYSAYISYKTYPDLKIFMDGRQEQVYKAGVFDDLMYFLNDMENSTLDKYKTDYILTSTKFAVLDTLNKSPQWVLIYSDNSFFIFARKELAKSKYKDPQKDTTTLTEEILETNFKKGYRI